MGDLLRHLPGSLTQARSTPCSAAPSPRRRHVGHPGPSAPQIVCSDETRCRRADHPERAGSDPRRAEEPGCRRGGRGDERPPPGHLGVGPVRLPAGRQFEATIVSARKGMTWMIRTPAYCDLPKSHWRFPLAMGGRPLRQRQIRRRHGRTLRRRRLCGHPQHAMREPKPRAGLSRYLCGLPSSRLNRQGSSRGPAGDVPTKRRLGKHISAENRNCNAR